MSQPNTHQTIIVQAPPSNGLGIAGFVISLISFLSCGLLGPVGLFFSCLGLLKEPRGFAIAGVILGALSSAWLFLGGWLLVMLILGFGAAVTAGTQALELEMLEIDMDIARITIVQSHNETSVLPGDAEGTALIQSENPVITQDMSYQRLDEISFRITGAGVDGELGTADDLQETYQVSEIPSIEEEVRNLVEPAGEPIRLQPEKPAATKDDDLFPLGSPVKDTAPSNESDDADPADTNLNLPGSFQQKTDPISQDTQAFSGLASHTFADVSGEHKIEAVLLGFDGKQVTLKKADGEEVVLPITQLSVEDRNYIRGEAKRLREAE
ncbi:MAG: hypothetical protein COA78_12585 [Blastopirellula sp.]|nr:MAG: hypothetical protein COA78_12585 [Blastopirellula sp.]